MLALTTFAWLRLLGSRDFAREFLNQLRYLDIEFLAKWRSTLFANRKNRKCANCTFAAFWSATYLKDSSTSMLIDGAHQKRRNHYSPLRLYLIKASDLNKFLLFSLPGYRIFHHLLWCSLTSCRLASSGYLLSIENAYTWSEGVSISIAYTPMWIDARNYHKSPLRDDSEV